MRSALRFLMTAAVGNLATRPEGYRPFSLRVLLAQIVVVGGPAVLIALLLELAYTTVVANRFGPHAGEYLQAERAVDVGPTFPTLPEPYAFKGAVVVIDEQTGLLNSPFYFSMKASLQANSPDQMKTLALLGCKDEFLGKQRRVEINTGWVLWTRSLIYTSCLVTFIDWESKARIFNLVIDSAGPEDEVTTPESKFGKLLSWMSSAKPASRDAWYFAAAQQPFASHRGR